MLGRILVVSVFILPLVYCSQKKGLNINANTLLCSDFDYIQGNVSVWMDWRCNFTYYKTNNICASIIDNHESYHIPMIWTFNSKTNYSCHADSSVNLVATVNEPNHVAQANLSPAQVAAKWPLAEGNATGKLLFSPSAANCSGENCNFGSTYAWFDEFFNLCSGCRIDYLSTHAYTCSAAKLMLFLYNLYQRYNKPIYLTEVACRQDNNNAAIVQEFMEAALPLLEEAEHVKMYAWFNGRIVDNSSWVQTSASIFDPAGPGLTPLGEFYLNFTSTQTTTTESTTTESTTTESTTTESTTTSKGKGNGKGK